MFRTFQSFPILRTLRTQTLLQYNIGPWWKASQHLPQQEEWTKKPFWTLFSPEGDQGCFGPLAVILYTVPLFSPQEWSEWLLRARTIHKPFILDQFLCLGNRPQLWQEPEKPCAAVCTSILMTHLSCFAKKATRGFDKPCAALYFCRKRILGSENGRPWI